MRRRMVPQSYLRLVPLLHLQRHTLITTPSIPLSHPTMDLHPPATESSRPLIPRMTLPTPLSHVPLLTTPTLPSLMTTPLYSTSSMTGGASLVPPFMIYNYHSIYTPILDTPTHHGLATSLHSTTSHVEWNASTHYIQ